MQIIADAEHYDRGFYTGVMGYYADSQLDSAVMIRFIEQEDNGQLYFKAGGGITAQSRYESEYNEVIQKYMCRFIETIRLDNGEIRNLSYHERRLNNTRMHFGTKVLRCNSPVI